VAPAPNPVVHLQRAAMPSSCGDVGGVRQWRERAARQTAGARGDHAVLGHLIGGPQIAELTEVAASPAAHVTIGAPRTAELIAEGQGDDAAESLDRDGREAVRNSTVPDLTAAVLAPAADRAIGAQRARVIATGGEAGNVA